MEFVDGANLRELLRAGRLPPGDAVAIVGQICDALQYAHERNLVHLDVKPDNFVVGENDEVKLIDFTSSRRPDPFASFAWATAYVYGAPEDVISFKRDVFSLGVSFKKMLEGSTSSKFPARSRLVKLVNDMTCVDAQRRPELCDVIRAIAKARASA